MTFPTKAKFVIIGAGIHGLSTARDAGHSIFLVWPLRTR